MLKPLRIKWNTPRNTMDDGLKNQYDAHKESLERALEDRSCKQANEVMMKAYLADMR